MKNRTMWALVLMLILTHIVPPNHVSFAEETENECKVSEFAIRTIVVGDKKIKGKGLSGQTLDLEFINTQKKDTIRINENDDFEYKLETDKLVENDKIIISNDYYKIETYVAGEGTSDEQIKSEQYVECPIKEPTEESSDEETSEEAETEEQSDVTSDEETSAEAETEEHSDTTSDEATSAEAETKERSEATSDEETSAEAETEKQSDTTSDEATSAEAEAEEQSDATSNEETSAEAETEEQSDATSDEETSAEAETEEQHEIEESTDEETSAYTLREAEESIAETFSVLSPNQIEATFQNTAAPIDEIQGSSVTVNTSQQFTNALTNNDIEYIKLSNNITTSGTIAVRARHGQKIINANGYSINFQNGQMELSSSGTLNRDVRKFIILNATNLFSSNAGNNGGLIKKTIDEVSIHFENVNFNANNNTSGGIFGSSWESDIHFYGTNIINTYKGNYSMAFAKVFVHSDADVTINNFNGKTAFRFDRNITILNRLEYGINVKPNGKLHVNSNAAVISTDLFKVSNRTFYKSFEQNSEVNFTGNGPTIFQIDVRVENNIINPKTVDYTNKQSNGLIYNNIDVDFNLIDTNLIDTTLKGWNRNNISDQPSNISQPISTGQFRFSENNTTNVVLTPQQPNFSTMFTPQLRRMQFVKSVPPIEILDVEGITDNDTEITGVTSPNVTVTMFDANDKIIQTVESNSNGEFTFELEEPFSADTLLRFQAQSAHVESDIVEKKVSGNRLELIDVPNTIQFESTEIQDGEIIINRENPNMNVSVMDTRSNSNWYLTAKALAPLTDEEGINPLNETLYYIEDNSEAMIEDEAVRVGEKDQSSDSDVQELSWGAGEGILLKLNPIAAQADTEYSTTIEWTLIDGP